MKCMTDDGSIFIPLFGVFLFFFCLYPLLFTFLIRGIFVMEESREGGT